MAGDKDPEVRRALAARTDIMPEILYFLVDDRSADVRREIAANQATPRRADLELAKDSDESVRALLATKIGGIIPELTPEEAKNLGHLAYDALAILTRDQVTIVRRIIAEALQNVAHVPPDIVNRLARDAEIAVSAPILENSPVLTDGDLLDILSETPEPSALSAIARRAHLGDSVSDAVARTGDIEAVGVLLTNPSAQIREDTLDWIISRAPQVEPWHAPLVHRPGLSGNAAMRIARFVADNLLETLIKRADLSAETISALREEVSQRLRDHQEQLENGAAPQVSGDGADGSLWKGILDDSASAQEAAETLQGYGQLDPAVIMEALACGEEEFVTAALAVKAGVPHGVAKSVVSMQNAKGIVALASRAEIPDHALPQLQISLCRISPAKILISKKPGEYPLTEEEITWQLEFFRQMAIKA